MKLPQFVTDVLKQIESEVKPIREAQISDGLLAAKRAQGDLSEEDLQGFMAEASAFFFYERREKDSAWGTYFAPMFTRTMQDGTVLHRPDILQLQPDVVSHWEARAEVTPHPIMKARYADLVWDLKCTICGDRPDVKFARMAIDSYIQGANRHLYPMAIEGIRWAERALDLALSIRDPQRTRIVVDCMFRLFDREAEPKRAGTWIFLFDNLYGRRNVITAEEEDKIVQQLEGMLRVASNPEDPGQFDPFSAQAASERLEQHYRKQKNEREVQRVVADYGKAFEHAADKAGPMLAMAWLQPVVEAYQKHGMGRDAERAQLASLEKAKNVDADMKIVSIPLEIKKEELEEFLNGITAGDLEKGLRRIAAHFIPDTKSAVGLLERMKGETPLIALTGVTRVGDGQIVSKAGSVEGDPEGRLHLQLAQDIDFREPFLLLAIDKLRERYQPTDEQILEFLRKSQVFPESRLPLLREGLSAYAGGDFVKAIHVLIPQIEHALRGLLLMLEIPPNKPVRNRPGIMQSKTVNDVLRDPRVRDVLTENVWRYFDVFLSDPKGHNLRNRVAHGLVDPNELNRRLADRVFHILLVLSSFREASPGGDAQTTPLSVDGSHPDGPGRPAKGNEGGD